MTDYNLSQRCPKCESRTVATKLIHIPNYEAYHQSYTFKKLQILIYPTNCSYCNNSFNKENF